MIATSAHGYSSGHNTQELSSVPEFLIDVMWDMNIDFCLNSSDPYWAAVQWHAWHASGLNHECRLVTGHFRRKFNLWPTYTQWTVGLGINISILFFTVSLFLAWNFLARTLVLFSHESKYLRFGCAHIKKMAGHNRSYELLKTKVRFLAVNVTMMNLQQKKKWKGKLDITEFCFAEITPPSRILEQNSVPRWLRPH